MSNIQLYIIIVRCEQRDGPPRISAHYVTGRLKKKKKNKKKKHLKVFYQGEDYLHASVDVYTRLQNARMLNTWLNIKNNFSRKRIKNRGMSCNRLCIPTFVV